ncbi:MAG: hypothetical protein QM755_16335 [Luteolibacter sp.]
MQIFHIAVVVYLSISMGFVAMLYWMGIQRRRLFSSLYEVPTFEDLDEKQAAQWAEIHQRKFDSGFWRVLMIAYMLWHYPGFLAHVLFRRESLYPIPMVVVSAIVWIGILYLVLAPSSSR